jgi:hypothetical protein
MDLLHIFLYKSINMTHRLEVNGGKKNPAGFDEKLITCIFGTDALNFYHS